VQSDRPLLNHVLERSLRDLRVLRSELHGHTFFAAGVPWYVTLFGRDSLISAYQTLAYKPEVAEHTLRLLAEYQGDKVDEWRDEEPGKIMHELRVGELARTDEIPQTPYYGAIDAAPLFLILLARHAAWTGRLALFHKLRENVERALEWMAKYGDPTGRGYLAYQVKSKKGLGNQGWKDSGDAIVNADGSLAKPPIALTEVQGYAYRAQLGVAELYRRAGDAGKADQLRREADDLRRRFNRDFWLEDKGVYALALQDGGKPCAVVASNAGQVLWSGIADADKARRTKDRLLAEDVHSGWGIRTLSAREKRYNPIGYHLGTVWPHDNSLILAGLRAYQFDEAAARVFSGILQAATHFHTYRLPEVFAGFRQEGLTVPVHYPVACHPQAWAAGSVPLMVESLLGLTPEAFDGRLRIVRPVLPEGVSELEVRRLRVGDARVHLRFRRGAGGKAEVDVLQKEGDLEVTMEATGNSADTPHEVERG
jgi:glycogen debranching enzyme